MEALRASLAEMQAARQQQAHADGGGGAGIGGGSAGSMPSNPEQLAAIARLSTELSALRHDLGELRATPGLPPLSARGGEGMPGVRPDDPFLPTHRSLGVVPRPSDATTGGAASASTGGRAAMGDEGRSSSRGGGESAHWPARMLELSEA